MSNASVTTQDTTARVALDLMDRIVKAEGDATNAKTRDYWFALYAQCHRAAVGSDLQRIREEK